MKKQRLSFKKRIVAAVILLLLIGTIYNIYDNNRFLVAEQDIFLSDLPESFDNYRILQISDLHGKYFGEQQIELLEAINGMEYDCILFTGDMNKYENSDSKSSQSILELLNGIENKETAVSYTHLTLPTMVRV